MRTNISACGSASFIFVLPFSFSLLFSLNNSIIRHGEPLDFNRSYTVIVFSCVTVCWLSTYIVIISMVCFMNEMKFLIRDDEKTPLKAENAMKWMTRRTRTNFRNVFTKAHSVAFQYGLLFYPASVSVFGRCNYTQNCMWRDCGPRKMDGRMKTHHKFGNDFPRNKTRLFITSSC